jgi:hypothetical protein
MERKPHRIRRKEALQIRQANLHLTSSVSLLSSKNYISPQFLQLIAKRITACISLDHTPEVQSRYLHRPENLNCCAVVYSWDENSVPPGSNAASLGNNVSRDLQTLETEYTRLFRKVGSWLSSNAASPDP